MPPRITRSHVEFIYGTLKDSMEFMRNTRFLRLDSMECLHSSCDDILRSIGELEVPFSRILVFTHRKKWNSCKTAHFSRLKLSAAEFQRCKGVNSMG